MPFAAKSNSFPWELRLTCLVVLRMEGGSSPVGAFAWAEEQQMRWFDQKWLVCQRWGEKPGTALRLGLRKLPRSQTRQSRDKKESCVQEEHRFLYVRCQHYSHWMGWTFIWCDLLTDAAEWESCGKAFTSLEWLFCAGHFARTILFHLYSTLTLVLFS